MVNSVNKNTYIEKIRQYNHLADYLHNSRFFRLITILPKYKAKFDEIKRLANGVIGYEDNVSIEYLATSEKKIELIFTSLKESMPYRIWNLINDIKNYTLVGPHRNIVFDNMRWPTIHPLVSIIIPCYNYGKYIKEAVDSVMNQTFNRLEIIIVNDGSNDNETLEVLHKLSNKYKVINQNNMGLAAARNTGIKTASGKYIICLDSDDMLKKDYVKLCVKKMEENNLDVCYTDYEEFGDSNKKWKTGEFDIGMLIHSNTVMVSACFKKETWRIVGGYDESMGNRGYEDWDFWIRIAKTGGIGCRIPRTLFLYRRHGSSMVDQAKNNHEELYNYIKSKHKDLFTNPFALALIKRKQNKEYFVTNKTINLD